MPRNTDYNIPVEIAGVRFRNPFYVSSGPTTMTVQQLRRIQECGWGGASLKLTIDPEPYINRVPRYGYYPERNYLSFTAEKRLILSELLELIEKGRKEAPDLVLFSNITYAGDAGVEGWVRMAKKCEDAGAHINELNMCCPNMSFNVELTGKSSDGPKTGASLGQNADAVAAIVRAVREETTIPLFVKITAEGGAQSRIAKAAIEAGANAVGGNANRLGIPPINLKDPTRSMYYLQKEVGMACLNGPWLKPLALRDVYEMRRLLGNEASITGTGGITTWEDAVEMMMCGADLIGVCTATLVYGFGIMPEFVEGFRRYMKEKGYSSPRDMRDLLVPAITTAPDLTIYPGTAQQVNPGLVAPCTYACPNSVPAQGYVRRVAEERFEEAYQLIMSRSPLQSICGKVCDHPCEGECTRGLKDQPIMIREIKRFVLEMAEKEGWKPQILSAKAPSRKQRVAVVGSGPAGLSCAYDLARAGYAVTVFEAADRLGGMLVSCIPSFRLSRDDVNKEIDTIRELGVSFETEKELGKDFTLSSLREEGFAATFVGIGCHSGSRLGIPGEDLDGVSTALDFLKKTHDAGRNAVDLKGKRVAVIGGGFTAMDSARTAVRLGAQEVFVLYRRTRDEMPATHEEIDEAEEEGVRVMYLVSPQAIEGDSRARRIRLLNYVLGEVDPSQRRKPMEVPGTEFTLDVDVVIAAIGQTVPLDAGLDLEMTESNSIVVDGRTCATNVERIYAGGDCTRGPSNVISAIADGKRAAASIDLALSGDDALLMYDPEKTVADKENVLRRTGDRPREWRPPRHALDPEKRRSSFSEYAEPLTREEAVKEASRCLICGCGAGCETCGEICKMFAWEMDPQGRMVLDKDKCVACGMCIHRCPNDNIEMVQTSETPI